MESTKEKVVTMEENKSTSMRNPRPCSPKLPSTDHFFTVDFGVIKTLLLVAVVVSCVIETTGLSYYGESSTSNIAYGSVRLNASSTSSEIASSHERYDPVEAYHQLRRYYLSNRGKHKDGKEDNGGSSGGQWANGGHNVYTSHTQPQHHHYNSHRNGIYTGGGGGASGGGGGSGSHHQTNHHHHHHHQQQLPQQPPPGGSSLSSPQRCYVCLPPNKNSREARDILGMFSPSDQAKIADCAGFGQHNSDDYEFTCPQTFGGCILRIHGPNISRACSRYRLNDCKKANGVEFCYCTQPLCNDVKQEPYKWPQKNTPQSHRSVGEGDDNEDDDEDSGGASGDSADVSSPSDSSAIVHHDSPPPPTRHSSYNEESGEDSESPSVGGPLVNFNLDKDNVATGSVIKSTGVVAESSSSPSFHYFSLLSIVLPLFVSR